MNTVTALVNYFPRSGLLLMVTYGLFTSMGFIFDWLNLYRVHRIELRIAQVLLLASVVLPILCVYLPITRPTLASRLVLSPLYEGSQNHLRASAPPANGLVKTSQANAILQSPPPVNISSILISGLLVSFLVGLFRLGSALSSLRRLINQSFCLRHYRRVVVSLSESINIPLSTLADFKFRVMIPASMCADRQKFHLALKHELQHHRQYDTHWAIAVEIMGLFFQWNPAFHIWKRKIVELQELACDEALVSMQNIYWRDYGACLLQVAENAWCLGSKHQVGVLGMAGFFHNQKRSLSFLRRRIEMLPKIKPGRTHSKPLYYASLWLLLLTMAVAFGTSTTPLDLSKPNPGIIQTNDFLQRTADIALKQALDKYHAKGAFAIVTDPLTGKVLAVSNLTREPQASKLNHWALGILVEPASAMKSLVAALAIDRKLTSPDKTYSCNNGSYVLEGKTYRDWRAFSKLTTTQSIEMSSNICGIKIAQELGAESLSEGLAKLGIGSGGSSQGFPEAIAGVIDPVSKLGSAQFTAQVGTGYGGIHLSPLELVMAYGSIANGGNLMRPLQANVDDAAAETVRRVFSVETARQMRTILAGVVKEGTATSIQNSPFKLAGKTSTAYAPESYDHKSLGGESEVAGFIGFAPADAPRVLVYVAVFDPAGGAHGSTQAAPVFKQIIESALYYLNVPPDRV